MVEAAVCYKRGERAVRLRVHAAPVMSCAPTPPHTPPPVADRRAIATRWASGVAHYENFPVGSILFPRALRPAVLAIYRFARYADDVADEGDAPAGERLAELARLGAALRAEAEHPEVARLRPFLRAHALPLREFHALLSAFAQDVETTRYQDFAAVRDYCTRSADPIGHLVLELFGARNAQSEPLADSICTALQLINFLQDLAIDWSRGRLYLPLDELAAAGLDERAIGAAVGAARAPAALRGLVRAQAQRCSAMLDAGAPLVARVPARLAWELRAILAGGRRILERIAANGYDPIAHRPTIGWRDAPALIRLMLASPVAR